VALFVVALLPRIYVAIAWTREPVWDGHYYDIGARNIAAGAGYVGLSGGAWCHYPVGYPALLGFGYALSGGHPYTGPLLNALLGALTSVLVYQLARAFTSDSRARVAGVLVALYPGLIAYTPLLMTETTSAFTLVLAAWVTARHGKHKRGLLVAGVLFGLATLVRPQTLLCAPFAGLLIPQLELGQRARAGAVATLMALLTVAPWTLRNCAVMDGCALVSTNGGWNLAIGASPRATGRFGTLRGEDGCRIVTGQVQQDRCWMRVGLGWVAADPLRWLALVDDKLGHTFDHESFPLGYLGEADPARWTEGRKSTGRQLLSWSYRALLLFAALGIAAPATRARPRSLLVPFGLLLLAFWGAATDTHPFWPLAIAIPVIAIARARALAARGALTFAAAAIATVALTHALFFGEDRYHMVLSPLLCLLAASAFERTTEASDTKSQE
jgi:4-amino-4-deoxy-L-arabinose transferase-like glycosyltransferase